MDDAAFSRDLISPESPEPASFGSRMAQYKRERGLPLSVNTGRKPIAEKYRKQVTAVEKTFADRLPVLAQEYVDELRPRDPEQCPVHHRTLRCPVQTCEHRSERTAFDHKAAAYALDRILGRTTVRVEATVTARFVEQLTLTLVSIFEECNEHTDPAARRAAFIDRCRALIAP
jgi:hypothetical protein